MGSKTGISWTEREDILLTYFANHIHPDDLKRTDADFVAGVLARSSKAVWRGNKKELARLRKIYQVWILDRKFAATLTALAGARGRQ